MLVRDVMQSDVWTVHEDESLYNVAVEMVKRGVRHATVTRDGSVVGVLSQRDVVGHRARFGRDGSVREAMTHPPFVTDPEESLASASAKMSTHRVGCLPVVAAGRLVGMITTTDLLTAFAQEEVPRPVARRAKDVMERNVLVVHPDDSLPDAVLRMLQNGVRHLPVVDGESTLVGMLSDRDVRSAIGDLRRALEGESALGRLQATRVRSVMSGQPYAVGPEQPLDEVGRVLVDQRVGALPVVDAQDKVIGMVSYIDVLRALLT
jgi:CBS domain-containing protein